MWVCPKCGRAFKKQNQSHYCGDAPKTIDQYIEAQSEEVQPYLLKIRNAKHRNAFRGACRLFGRGITSFILLPIKNISDYMRGKKRLLNLEIC